MVVEDFEIEFVGPSRKEKKLLVQKCIRGLKSKNDRDFYQATAAAEFVGRDKRLVRPLIEAFKKRRGWKRQLVLQAIEYLNCDKEIYLCTETKRSSPLAPK